MTISAWNEFHSVDVSHLGKWKQFHLGFESQVDLDSKSEVANVFVVTLWSHSRPSSGYGYRPYLSNSAKITGIEYPSVIIVPSFQLNLSHVFSNHTIATSVQFPPKWKLHTPSDVTCGWILRNSFNNGDKSCGTPVKVHSFSTMGVKCVLLHDSTRYHAFSKLLKNISNLNFTTSLTFEFLPGKNTKKTHFGHGCKTESDVQIFIKYCFFLKI